MELYESSDGRHSHAQVVLKKQMELLRIEWWETQPRTGSHKETNGTVDDYLCELAESQPRTGSL